MTVNFEMYFIQSQLFKIKLGIKAAKSKCPLIMQRQTRAFC